MKNKLLLFLCFILIGENTYAQKIQTGRPTQAYGTATMPKGLFQIETGSSFFLMDSSMDWNLSQTTLRYGVVNNFDFYTSIQVQYKNPLEAPQFDGNLSMGLRYRIVNKKVQLSYWAGVILPPYPSLLSANQVLAMTHPVGQRVTFGYSIAHKYNFEHLRSPNYGGDLQGSFVIHVQLMERLACFFGINTYWNSINGNIELLYDAGCTYLIKDNLQFDLFWGHGLNHKKGIYGLGLSWLIYKNKER